MARTFYLLSAYDGTRFHGWQCQPGQRTVQGVLEAALRRVARHEADLIGCGRTDSGVHAIGHVSSFTTTRDLPPDRFRHAIGSRLPTDLSVIALREVQPAFDARRHAVSKLYRYSIHHASHRPVETMRQRYVHHIWHRLDVDRMRRAARHFIGTQDFAAMAAKAEEKPSTVRTVLRCEIERSADEIRIDVMGTGFLYHQVRNMVGTLLSVGRGQWEPDYVREILASRDRRVAGPTAPAQGLCLRWVRYPPELLRAPVRPMEQASTSEDVLESDTD